MKTKIDFLAKENIISHQMELFREDLISGDETIDIKTSLRKNTLELYDSLIDPF